MIEIVVKVDSIDALRTLDSVQRKQIPFATALALTRTAKLVQKSLQNEFGGKLNASPYTMRSTFSTSATKSKLQAIVGVKDKKPAGGTAPSVLLKEHFSGGARGFKPMERAIATAAKLPQGMRVVPAEGMPLNAYGNPKRAIVREVIGALRTGMNVHKKRIKYGVGQLTTTAGYFVALHGNPRTKHLAPGIYRRYGELGRAIVPVFLFIDSASYTKRFDLPRLAKEVVSDQFDSQFIAAFNQASATAR